MQFSGRFAEFPVKLRVVIQKPRDNTVLVRHYEIEKYSFIEIKVNGDIWCDGDGDRTLAARNGKVMEFNSKDGQSFYETISPNFLPRTFDISSTAASTKFWTKEKVVLNALLCCQVHNNFSNFSCMFAFSKIKIFKRFWIAAKKFLLYNK